MQYFQEVELYLLFTRVRALLHAESHGCNVINPTPMNAISPSLGTMMVLYMRHVLLSTVLIRRLTR